MSDDTAFVQLRELVEDHLSRGAPRDIPLAALTCALGAILSALGEVQARQVNWASVRDKLRHGMRDGRSALQMGSGDARLDGLRVFAERQFHFAALLDEEIARVTAGETTLVSVVPRQRVSVHLRTFPGWERLRQELALALGLPVAEVLGLSEPGDPAVRIEAIGKALGFQLDVDLFVDRTRVALPAVPTLAARLAVQTGVDVAYHDGSTNPYAYVIQRATGERVAASEVPDSNADGLLLDESPDPVDRSRERWWTQALDPELREVVHEFQNGVLRLEPGPGLLVRGLVDIESALVALTRDQGAPRAIGRLLDSGSRQISLGVQRAEGGGREHLAALARRYMDFALVLLRDYPELRPDG